MSRRRIFVGLAILATVIVVAIVVANLPSESALTQADNGRTVSAQVGDKLQIRLTENPSTGYLWQATAAEGLVITRTEYQPDDRSGTLAGSGGVRTWTLELTKPGSHEFSAALYPPDAAADPVSKFSVVVAATP